MIIANYVSMGTFFITISTNKHDSFRKHIYIAECSRAFEQ